MKFYDDTWFFQDEAETTWHGASSPQPHSQYVLNWSGSNSLAECIQESLTHKGGSGKIYIFPSRCPDYIRVRYKPESRTFRACSEMRHASIELFVAVEISATSRKFELRKQATTYNVCAVMRIGDGGQPDDVRTYWKSGHEIVPSPAGIVQEKDFEASLPRWTVAGKGRFDLYFYRVPRDKHSDPEWSGIDESAPEFEEREWVVKERESQALRSPTSSAMQPSIQNEDTADIPASSATPTGQLPARKENPFLDLHGPLPFRVKRTGASSYTEGLVIPPASSDTSNDRAAGPEELSLYGPRPAVLPDMAHLSPAARTLP